MKNERCSAKTQKFPNFENVTFVVQDYKILLLKFTVHTTVFDWQPGILKTEHGCPGCSFRKTLKMELVRIMKLP